MKRPTRMKRILLFLILISFPVYLWGQLNGDGSVGSPYNGTLDQDEILNSGTIYIDGDIINPGYVLTIQPGTILMIEDYMSILVSDYGVIDAQGTLSDSIKFFANGSAWGQINLNGASGIFDYCAFVKGNGASGGAINSTLSDLSISHCSFRYNTSSGNGGSIYLGNNPSAQISNSVFKYSSADNGGAIYFNTSPATITGCVFSNNSCISGGGLFIYYSSVSLSKSILKSNSASSLGGAIYLNGTSTTTVDTCRIFSNSAVNAGGGIYFNTASSGTVRNTLIYLNNCSNATGGGGVSWGYSTTGAVSGNIISCVLANNSSNDITFRAPYRVTMKNTIVWGSADKYVYFLTTAAPQSTSLTNCAVQGVYNSSGEIPISTFPTSFKISSSNTAAKGPNFINPGIYNYATSFISPCRDAGTPTGVPLTDFLGKPRISTPDIGAYEVQYSLWTGTAGTDWSSAANWEDNVSPSVGSGDYVIPFVSTNFPTASGITVGTGKFLVLQPKAQLTTSSLSNSGTVRLKSDNTGTSSLIITGSHTNSGKEISELYLTGGPGTTNPYNYHYISVPFPNHNLDSVTLYTTNLLEYENRLVTTSMQQGWQYYDDPQGFTSFNLGSGYNFYHNSSTKSNYSFSGTFNTGSVTVPLHYDDVTGTPDPNIHGRNLVGNPFTSSINWDVAAAGLNATTSKSIVFTSGSLGYVYYLANVGSPTPGVTNIIPPMQGFFMKTSTTGGTNFTLNPSTPGLLVHNATQARYKKGDFEEKASDVPLLRMKVSNSSFSDYTLLWMNEKATMGTDNDFDAGKFVEDRLTLWSSLSGKNYAINGIPFPEGEQLVPLGLNIKAAGTYRISAETLQNLDQYDITLIDKTLNSTTNLKSTSEYVFTSTAGIIADRFIIKISNLATFIPEEPIIDKVFNVYEFDSKIIIEPLSEQLDNVNGKIRIHDLTGRIVSQQNKFRFTTGKKEEMNADFKSGIYLVEITAGRLRYVSKVVIK